MRCPSCGCEYPDWLRTCPPCGSALEQAPLREPCGGRLRDYAELTDRVTSAGGRLGIDLAIAAVGMESIWRFPYRGFGHAWADRLVSVSGELAVDLRTTDVGRHRLSRLLYWIGYGFAWTRRLEGEIAGHPAWLEATRVEMERQTRFPYRGYGFAWTQEMAGRCGERLALTLEATDVARRMRYEFPYQGFGYAWMSTARLTLEVT